MVKDEQRRSVPVPDDEAPNAQPCNCVAVSVNNHLVWYQSQYLSTWVVVSHQFSSYRESLDTASGVVPDSQSFRMLEGSVHAIGPSLYSLL
jgi:hypothetical protein